MGQIKYLAIEGTQVVTHCYNWPLTPLTHCIATQRRLLSWGTKQCLNEHLMSNAICPPSLLCRNNSDLQRIVGGRVTKCMY